MKRAKKMCETHQFRSNRLFHQLQDQYPHEGKKPLRRHSLRPRRTGANIHTICPCQSQTCRRSTSCKPIYQPRSQKGTHRLHPTAVAAVCAQETPQGGTSLMLDAAALPKDKIAPATTTKTRMLKIILTTGLRYVKFVSGLVRNPNECGCTKECV